MKKILGLLLALMVINVASTNAQFLSKETVTQKEADVQRLWVWDIPKTVKISLNKISTEKTTRVIVGFTSAGLGRYMLLDTVEYDKVVNFFTSDKYKAALENLAPGEFLGYEFVVAFVQPFSWLSKSQIKKLTLTEEEKKDLRAFNSSTKYRMMGQNPLPATGQRNKNFNIVPTLEDGSNTATNQSPLKSEQGQKVSDGTKPTEKPSQNSDPVLKKKTDKKTKTLTLKGGYQ